MTKRLLWRSRLAVVRVASLSGRGPWGLPPISVLGCVGGRVSPAQSPQWSLGHALIRSAVGGQLAAAASYGWRSGRICGPPRTEPFVAIDSSGLADRFLGPRSRHQVTQIAAGTLPNSALLAAFEHAAARPARRASRLPRRWMCGGRRGSGGRLGDNLQTQCGSHTPARRTTAFRLRIQHR